MLLLQGAPPLVSVNQSWGGENTLFSS